jgi:hypothetical protein
MLHGVDASVFAVDRLQILLIYDLVPIIQVRERGDDVPIEG